jgi:hypothetical protein
VMQVQVQALLLKKLTNHVTKLASPPIMTYI